jgi:hypothetical protein
MRLSKSLAIAASTLALATGAAFAGDSYSYHSYEQGGPELLSDAQTESEPMDALDNEYLAQPQEYEVYEVYMVPAEIVLIPIEPREGPITGDELG